MNSKSEYLTIGEMSRLNHVSRKKLLVLADYDLVKPEIVNPQTGYRYYSIQQCAALDIVMRLQQYGLSLEEIKALSDRKDITALQDALLSCRSALSKQIHDLSLYLEDIGQMLAACRNRQNPPVLGAPALEWMEKKCVLKYDVTPYPVGLPLSEEVAPLYNWESSLRSIKTQIISEDLPLCLFHNVGCIVSRASLEARHPVCTGGFVDNPHHLGNRKEYWEAGWYLTAVIGRMYDEKGNHRELAFILRLIDIARENGYRICGDYFCEVLAESPALFYEGRDMMLRLCLPVEVDNPEVSPYYHPGPEHTGASQAVSNPSA